MKQIKLHFIIEARNSDVFYITNSAEEYDKTLEIIDIEEIFDENIIFIDAINYVADKYSLSKKYKRDDVVFTNEIFFTLWSKYFNVELIEEMYLSDSFDIYNLELGKLDQQFNISNLDLKLYIVTGVGGVVGRDEEYGIKFIMHANNREKDRHNIEHVEVIYDNISHNVSIKNLEFLDGTFSKRKINEQIKKLIEKNKEGLLNYWNDPVKYTDFKMIINIED